ncbi:hypothetical protein K2173_007156 [Erythroxylum novogranatense]|uniref:Uncharacterized protein n=1 Tax=Erythroxylum novogranatense TaxID=1862640 RepID=A0AAV8SYH7_9ROSI|nr:hypothetical protein K2173_007156 [Erythroxylum novogranatense]
MMNFLALSLVLTSLIAAQVWSPVPGKKLDKKEDEVIVKEGHRIIVVETYDEDGHHNTKVSISPEQRDDNSENIEPGGKFKSGMVMFERLKIEKEEGRGRESQATEAEQRQATDPTRGATTKAGEAPAIAGERTERDEATSRMVILSGRLKKLNSYSSLLNILTLMYLTCIWST